MCCSTTGIDGEKRCLPSTSVRITLAISLIAIVVSLALIALKTFYSGGLSGFISDFSQLASNQSLCFGLLLSLSAVSTFAIGLITCSVLAKTKAKTMLATSLFAVALVSALTLFLMYGYRFASGDNVGFITAVNNLYSTSLSSTIISSVCIAGLAGSVSAFVLSSIFRCKSCEPSDYGHVL